MHPIEKALGYTFRDPDHLTRALTHRSHSAKHNERLEYLGDALLETISSIWIYNNRPAVPEGDLTRLRATIVKEDSLVGVARRLNLGEHLRLGSGELKTGATSGEYIAEAHGSSRKKAEQQAAAELLKRYKEEKK